MHILSIWTVLDTTVHQPMGFDVNISIFMVAQWVALSTAIALLDEIFDGETTLGLRTDLHQALSRST